MIRLEQEIIDIFNKSVITRRDISRASRLLRIWKEMANWQEATSNPIKA